MKILIGADVSPFEQGSGAERLLQAHARELARRGHELRIVFRAPPPTPAHHQRNPAPGDEWEGCLLFPYAVDRGGSLSFLRTTLGNGRRAAARATSSWQPDVVNVYQPFTGLALLRANRPPAPLMYTFLSPAPAELKARAEMAFCTESTPAQSKRRPVSGGVRGRLLGAGLRWVEDRVLRRADRISVLSDFMSDEILAWHPRVDRHRIVRIPGGVDTASFVPVADRAGLRAELGYPAGRKLLLTVRNLEPRTGVENLLAAIIRLASRRRDFLLLIAGLGPLAERLEETVRSAEIADMVRFLGFVEEAELRRLYAAADLYIQPDTDLQGFGLPIVEAMACGTPVLATPVGGAVDILRPIDDQLLFSSVEPETIATELGAALDDRDIIGSRDRYRRIAEERFAWPRVVDQVEALMAAMRREHDGR